MKTALLAACALIGAADIVTTNVILSHGGGELNPVMALAQDWLGAWWVIPKLGATFLVIWLLSRSNNLWNIATVVGLVSTAVVSNLLVICL